MPFARPTLQVLVDRAEADIATRLPGADAGLRRSVLNVLARVAAGAAHGLYGFISFIARQVIIDTAEVEFLDRWAGVWGIARKAAAFAAGPVDFTGTDGATVTLGSEVQRGDGARFSVDADATIAAGAATAQVTALVAGDDANTAASAAVTLVSPIAGVQSAALVGTGGLAGGADAESDAGLRTRLLARIQQPPQGGAEIDYQTWALEVAGVTRVWVFEQELGLGTVTVRFTMDDTYSDGIPLAADVTALQAYIDARRPVTADVTVVAPIAVPSNFTISSLSPNTQAVKDAIEAELKALIRREAVPGGTILISHIREAISIAAGETDHVLDAPLADVTHTSGQIATFGAITWV